MKAHIVFAHPNVQSYNGQLRNAAIKTLESLGWTVSVSDLYQSKFKASADEDDFTELFNTDFFDLQLEQQRANEKQTFSEDIKNEHQLLSEADLIILQFPLWWSSMPALLKGYIDRVFSMGWAYGGGQALAGKEVLVCTTTGAPKIVWTVDKRGTIRDNFRHLLEGTFGLCGMNVIEPFIVYGAKLQTEQEKNTAIDLYQKYITDLINKKI